MKNANNPIPRLGKRAAQTVAEPFSGSAFSIYGANAKKIKTIANL
jgi:hypothetical protein